MFAAFTPYFVQRLTVPSCPAGHLAERTRQLQSRLFAPTEEGQQQPDQDCPPQCDAALHTATQACPMD